MSEIKKQISKLLKSKLESSSFIILPNIYRSEYIQLKFVWLILSFICVGWCSWLMSRTVIDYFNYDVITKTEVKYETHLIFPVITICNTNPFTTEYSRKFITSLFNSSEENFDNYFLTKYLVNYHIAKNLTDPYLFGQKLDEIIVSCTYGLNECNLNEDFEHYYDFNYGNCYRFNSGKNMNGKQVKQRYANALFGVFDVQLWAGPAQNNYNFFSIDNGLILFITNESTNTALANGINISPGFSTKISLEKLTITKKPKPYSNCIDNLNTIDSYHSLAFKKLISQNQNQTYNYVNCYILCLQKHLGDKCQCQLKFLDSIYYEEMRLCFSISSSRDIDNQCFIDSLKLFLNDSKPYLTECDCPIECEYNFFRYSNSFAEFPSRNILPYMINSVKIKSILNQSNLSDSLETFELLRKSIARVQISYQDMMQTFITEYPKMQSTDLVSSLGGLIGLFLGLSFLSFIEIFDFLLQLINILLKTNTFCRIKKQNSPTNRINVKSVDRF